MGQKNKNLVSAKRTKRVIMLDKGYILQDPVWTINPSATRVSLVRP